jgi:hypothetical protein
MSERSQLRLASQRERIAKAVRRSCAVGRAQRRRTAGRGDANRPRLNDKQVAYLAALIPSITSDSYSDGPKGEEARAKSRAIIESNDGIFTKEEMTAMQPYAPCLAKTK